MYTNVYDTLDYIEQRNRDLRREAADYRLAQSVHIALVPGPSLLDRVRPLLARLHLARPLAGQAKLPA